jgi:uncharacterized coiled-coil protein SlyX
MTDKEFVEILRIGQSASLNYSADRIEVLNAELTEAKQQIARLKDWQADVTVSLRNPGGAFFEDVPKHIAALVQRAEAAEARVTNLEGRIASQQQEIGVLNRLRNESNRTLEALYAELAQVKAENDLLRADLPEQIRKAYRQGAADQADALDAALRASTPEGEKP